MLADPAAHKHPLTQKIILQGTAIINSGHPAAANVPSAIACNGIALPCLGCLPWAEEHFVHQIGTQIA